MTSHEQRQQQPPRRILEKSRTVRRRYQRSNKRLEFTPSQIQRIEREEERERKAQRLRENEKKKLANKKKKAEKEAKEREERRRLGIPDPNTAKIPASQPLLLNFFGAGNKTKDAEEANDEERKDCREESTEVSRQEDVTDAITETFSDADTELGDDWFQDIGLEEQVVKEAAHASPLNISNTDSSLSPMLHGNNQTTMPEQTAGDTPMSPRKLNESFEDDTALLLQTLDPDVLQTFETPKQPRLDLRGLSKTGSVATASEAILNMNCNIISSTWHSSSVTRHFETPNLTNSAKIRNGRVKDINNDNFKTEWASPRPSTGYTSARPLHEIRTPCHDALDFVKELKKADTVPVDAKRCLHFSPKETVSKDTTRNIVKGPRFEVHPIAEDEYDDLPLSTQDVRDLDSMIGLG